MRYNCHVITLFFVECHQALLSSFFFFFFFMKSFLPEENLAKSESSMLPESKMDFDYTIDYRKH